MRACAHAARKVEGVGKGLAPALVASLFAASLLSTGGGALAWGASGGRRVFWALAATNCGAALAARSLPEWLEPRRRSCICDGEAAAAEFKPSGDAPRCGDTRKGFARLPSLPKEAQVEMV